MRWQCTGVAPAAVSNLPYALTSPALPSSYTVTRYASTLHSMLPLALPLALTDGHHHRHNNRTTTTSTTTTASCPPPHSTSSPSPHPSHRRTVALLSPSLYSRSRPVRPLLLALVANGGLALAPPPPPSDTSATLKFAAAVN